MRRGEGAGRSSWLGWCPGAGRLLAAGALTGVLAGCVAGPEPLSVVDPAPDGGGQASRPPVHPGPLADLLDEVVDLGWTVHHVRVLRKGVTMLAADVYPYRSELPHDVASVTKSVVSTLVGIAIEEGAIPGLDARVLDYFPEIDLDTARGGLADLRLEHLLTMTSGWCRTFEEGEAQLEAMRNSGGWVTFMLSRPLVDPPGTRFAYCSGASQVLSAVLTRATGVNAESYARRVLFGPLGIEDYRWPSDPQGHSTGWGDLFLRPEDLARIGQLFLQEGVWKGRRVVPEDWIRRATTERVSDGDEGYGYRWWIPNSLPGLYEARGRGGQRLVVWPDKEVVVVLLGSGFDPSRLGGHIVAALSDETPAEATPAGRARLGRALERAASAPPGPEEFTPPSIDPSVLGVRWILEPNPVGITAFSVERMDPAEAVLTLTLHVPRSGEYGDRRTRVGLDGRDRMSPSGRFGLPVAARGQWPDPWTFQVRYDEPAGNHLYAFEIRFGAESATLSIRENTGLVATELSARREPLEPGRDPDQGP